jgi:hypothetical protein
MASDHSDERFTVKETEGLIRKTRGTAPSGDDTNEAHGRN